MDRNRAYSRCHIMGEGEILTHSGGPSAKFKLIDMSASGVRIESAGDVDVGEERELKIVFDGYLFEIVVNVTGKVRRKEVVNGFYEYGIEFVNLSQKNRIELDELMKRSCSIGYHTGNNICEDGNCVFFSAKNLIKF